MICASIIIGAGYGRLALTLARRGLDHLLASRRAALEFSAGAALTALAVSGGYAATFVAAGVLPASSAVDAIERNWVGDLNGILTLTPLLLAAPLAPTVTPPPDRVWELPLVPVAKFQVTPLVVVLHPVCAVLRALVVKPGGCADRSLGELGGLPMALFRQYRAVGVSLNEPTHIPRALTVPDEPENLTGAVRAGVQEWCAVDHDRQLAARL